MSVQDFQTEKKPKTKLIHQQSLNHPKETKSHLFVRNALDLVTGSFDSVLRSHDGDDVAVLLLRGEADLSRRRQLQTFQLLSFRAQDKAMVIFRDLDLHARL